MAPGRLPPREQPELMHRVGGRNRGRGNSSGRSRFEQMAPVVVDQHHDDDGNDHPYDQRSNDQLGNHGPGTRYAGPVMPRPFGCRILTTEVTSGRTPVACALSPSPQAPGFVLAYSLRLVMRTVSAWSASCLLLPRPSTRSPFGPRAPGTPFLGTVTPPAAMSAGVSPRPCARRARCGSDQDRPGAGPRARDAPRGCPRLSPGPGDLAAIPSRSLLTAPVSFPSRRCPRPNHRQRAQGTREWSCC